MTRSHCVLCNLSKALSDFHKDKTKKEGFRRDCKECRKKYSFQYHQNNKEKLNSKGKIYNIHNKERVSIQKKLYYRTNKNIILAKKKAYYSENKEIIQQRKKFYPIKDKAKARAKDRAYRKNKRLTDVQFRLRTTLRSRLNIVIKNNQKTGSAVQDLGCSIKELKIHLESLFQSGMNWNNWSLKGWHIDHIKPLSKFDLTKREELLKACNYTNLQPLWAEDNLKKGNKNI